MPPTQTQNRKDLLQAYRLMTQRTALALIAGEPDSPNQPLRRRNTATVSGVLVAVIACAVFGVMGIIQHGGKEAKLTTAGTLTIDSDTATAYVPCDGSTELCPALNYASARLALKSANPSTRSVHQKGLAGYKIGPAIGIAGLPADLPTSSNLVKGPWSVCVDNGVSTLVGGTSVHGTPLNGNSVELVSAAPGQDWVVWNGTRMEVPPKLAGLWSQNPSHVSMAWLGSLPEGPAFSAPDIPGRGVQTVPGPGGVPAKVGTLYQATTASAATDYVLEGDAKLYKLTSLQSTLLQDTGAGQPQPVNPSAALAHSSGSAVPSPGMPARMPVAGPAASTLCAVYGSGGNLTVTTGGTIPDNYTGTGNGNATHVDRVSLPPGSGALIGVGAAAGQPASQVKSWALLEGATRYGLAGPGVASFLGYDLSSSEVVLPASLVDVLPVGKALDPNAATQTASG